MGMFYRDNNAYIMCENMLQTQWVIYSAEMWQIHKWSIDGLERKIE